MALHVTAVTDLARDHQLIAKLAPSFPRQHRPFLQLCGVMVSCVVEAMIKPHVIVPAGHLSTADLPCWKLLLLPHEIQHLVADFQGAPTQLTAGVSPALVASSESRDWEGRIWAQGVSRTCKTLEMWLISLLSLGRAELKPWICSGLDPRIANPGLPAPLVSGTVLVKVLHLQGHPWL